MANGSIYHQLTLTPTSSGGAIMMVTTQEAPLPELMPVEDSTSSGTDSTSITSPPKPSSQRRKTTRKKKSKSPSRSKSPSKSSKGPSSMRNMSVGDIDDDQFLHPEMLYGTTNCRSYSTNDIRDISTSSWTGLDLEDTKTVETFMSPIPMTPTSSKSLGQVTNNVIPLPLLATTVGDDSSERIFEEDELQQSLDEIIKERRQNRRRERRGVGGCSRESGSTAKPRKVNSLTQLFPLMKRGGGGGHGSKSGAVVQSSSQTNAEWPQKDGSAEKPRKVRSLTQLISSPMKRINSKGLSLEASTEGSPSPSSKQRSRSLLKHLGRWRRPYRQSPPSARTLSLPVTTKESG